MLLIPIENFFRETVARRWSTVGAGNFYVSDHPVATTGYLTLSPSNESLREIIYFSAKGTDGNGKYVTIADASDRGLGGTTAQTHEVGEPVRMNITAEHWNDADTKLTAKPSISSGAGAPASTPTKVGDIYVDTTGHKVYMADGTVNSGNWLILN